MKHKSFRAAIAFVTADLRHCHFPHEMRTAAATRTVSFEDGSRG